MASALRSHPELFVPKFKEARHFGFVLDNEVGGARYRKFFSEWTGQPVVGEATPEYLYKPRCAEQICKFLPDVKAIVQLRNPVDRAYSAYWHGVRTGWLEGTFSASVDAEFGDGGSDPSSEDVKAFNDIVKRGQYAEQIQRYFDFGFDRKRMLVILLGEVVTDPRDALTRVQEFLGVTPVVTEFPRVNPAQTTQVPRLLRKLMFQYWKSRTVNAVSMVTVREFTPPPMEPEVRARLIDHFRPWNDRLSELLGRDFSDWNR